VRQNRLIALLAKEVQLMLKPEVFAILCSPDDHTALTAAAESLVAEANSRIRNGELVNRAGRIVESHLGGGLINASGDMMYPIIHDIPVLVRDEAIPLAQLSANAK
jgi:uncharacterized protein YbaR (Trm112 family)